VLPSLHTRPTGSFVVEHRAAATCFLTCVARSLRIRRLVRSRLRTTGTEGGTSQLTRGIARLCPKGVRLLVTPSRKIASWSFERVDRAVCQRRSVGFSLVFRERTKRELDLLDEPMDVERRA